ALADKLARARGRARCDHAFYVGATPENAEALADLEQVPGCCGVKMFMGSSTGSLLVSADADVARVLRSGRRRVAVHAEDEARLPHARREGAALTVETLGHGRRADAAPADARPRRGGPARARATGRAHQRGAGARVRNPGEGPNRNRLRRGSGARGSQATRND